MAKRQTESKRPSVVELAFRGLRADERKGKKADVQGGDATEPRRRKGSAPRSAKAASRGPKS